MKFIFKYKIEILLSLFLFVVYFITRFTNILHLPIFTDEAIYVRWSQIAKQDASWRFISLTDGRQPMYVWVTMIIMRFIKDPLFAGRTTSVVTGFLSMIGMFLLSRELFKNKWIGFISSGIYSILPFALVYDRMALYDSMVTMFAIWGLYVEVLLVRRLRSDIAFIAGLVVGGGMLTKSNAFFNIYFLPFTILLFDFVSPKKMRRFVRWLLLAALVTILAYLYYSILRLSPYFGIIGEKNYTFIYSFHDWIRRPFDFFAGNFHGLFGWMVTYTNWLGFGLAVVSFIFLKKFWREKLLLLVWLGLPFIALSLFGKVIYPRYILPMVIFLIPLMALTLYALWENIKTRAISIVILVLLIALYLYVDRFIIFDFVHAPIPGPDLDQYANSWPSGEGMREVDAYLLQQSQKQKIFIGTEGTYGLMPESVEMYLANNPNITIKGYWPISKNLPYDLVKASKTMPTYVIFYQPCVECSNTNEPPTAWPVKLIAKYKKGIGNWYTLLYKIEPSE